MVTLEGTGRGEFAQLMADHVFGDEDGHMFPPIVHGNGVSDEGRQNHGSAGPGLDDLFIISGIKCIDLFNQGRMDIRSFFN